MARINIEAGGGRREIDLSGIISIGRQNNSSIHIDDPIISRNHARIYSDGKDWILEDLQSRTGTRVNGKEISKATILKHKDTISIGKAHLEFETEASPSSLDNSEGEGKWVRKQGALQFPVKLQLYFILLSIGIISTFGFHSIFLWIFDNQL